MRFFLSFDADHFEKPSRKLFSISFERLASDRHIYDGGAWIR